MSKLESSLVWAVRFCERMQERLAQSVVIVIALLTLAGCSAVAPDNDTAVVPLPLEWSGNLRDGLNATEPKALARWWTTLNDPDLSNLIERAVTGNLNLKNAQARIREARARRGIAEAGLLPAINLSSSINFNGSTDEIGVGLRGELYRTGFDASWEIDVFGGMHRSIEAAHGDLEATAADGQHVLVSLLAEVALNYVEARTFQTQLQAAEENLKTQAETLQLTEWRFAAGLVSQLDVEQAKANLESTRSQLPRLRSNIETVKNRLAILLGVVPGTLNTQLEAKKPIPGTPPEVAVGVPADLLRRRPDVRRAERQLAAQTARVGAATAELYPKFSLPGSIGLEAVSMNHLFSSASGVWSLVSGFSWPIFRGGAIRQNIEVQSALQEQALQNYEATILNALEEVESSLVAYAEEQDRKAILTEATRAAKRAAAIARDQYISGLIDFRTVLDADRSVFSYEDQLAQSKGQVAANLISLYKALGGGWTTLPAMLP